MDKPKQTPSVDEVIRASTAIVRRGRYAYLKTREKNLKNHFFVSQDNDETTVVTEEAAVQNTEHESIVKWFKLIEIKVAVPFFAGFVARVTNALASKGLNTLVVSTFSKDYILTKEDMTDPAIATLRQLGFRVELEA